MKNIAVLMTTLMLSVSAFAGNWKLVATDTIWPNMPPMKIYPINSKDTYSSILIRVNQGNLRINNAFIWLKNKGQMPLWSIQGDYRSPRDGAMNFLADQAVQVRLDAINLDGNRPAQIQIFLR